MKKFNEHINNCIIFLITGIVVVGGFLLFVINEDLFRTLGVIACVLTLTKVVIISKISKPIIAKKQHDKVVM